MKKNNIIPAISVLIPVYNVEEYLEECVESVLKQSFQDFEIILVDDCSSDNSLNICKKLENSDSRIKVICHKNNRGVSAARNTCLRAAIGKYIAYVDSDDIIKTEYLMEMYQLAEKYDADVVATGGTEYKLNENGEWVEGVKIELAEETLMLTEDITTRMENMAKYKFSPNIWSKLINRRVFVENEICRFEAIQFEDVLFHFPLLYSAKRYILSPCNSYLYRQSPESICRGSNLEKTKKAMRSILGCMKSVDKYMAMMSDVYDNNIQLQYDTRYFFARYLFEIYYLRISEGYDISDILIATYHVLDEDKVENAGLLMFLIHDYLKNLTHN